MKTEHLLIIRLSSIADMAMTVPVVKSLATQYPHIRITILGRPFAKPLFKNLAANVGFMEADVKNEYKGLKGLNALYRRLAAKKFTAVADFQNAIKSKYLRLRFNVDRYRVAHIGKRNLRNHATVQQTEGETCYTVFQCYADTLKALGYPIQIKFDSLFGTAKGNLRQLPPPYQEKKSFQQWIGIAPFANMPAKMYPLDQMIQVIQGLLAKHPSCRIFIFARNDKDIQTAEDLLATHKHCVLVHQYVNNMQEELILMSHLNVLLTMDNANMHLASLVATPTISVWNTTYPNNGHKAWNQKDENILQMNVSDNLSDNKDTPQRNANKCVTMMYITPQTIIEKIDNVLNTSGLITTSPTQSAILNSTL